MLDPSLLHDDDMHGGVDRIMSTILKSKSSVSSESNEDQNDHAPEEKIEADIEEPGNEPLDLAMQIDNQSSDGNKIKIIDSCTKPIGIKEEDIEKMDPEYAVILERIVKNEFYQLQREIESKESKRKESQKFKKCINFMHILQKRVKEKIRSKKTKLEINNIEKSKANLKSMSLKETHSSWIYLKFFGMIDIFVFKTTLYLLF